MRSLELACLIIALVVFADVSFLLLSNNSASNLRSLARVLALTVTILRIQYIASEELC